MELVVGKDYWLVLLVHNTTFHISQIYRLIKHHYLYVQRVPSLSLLVVRRDEQNRRNEQPTNKANGNQKSLGHLKGAKTIAR